MTTHQTENILSLDEIYDRYPDEWVLIAYTELDEDGTPLWGEVIAHSSDRDEVYDMLPLRKDKAVAIEYTGPLVDEGMGILL